MALYDYRCEKCGEVFEVRQKFSDEVLQEHEGCGGELERLISAPALQFKGTGWYVTDYAAKSGSSGSKEESAKPAESTAESKSGEEKSKDKDKKTESHHKDTKEKPKDSKKKAD